MKLALTNMSMKHPWMTIILAVALTAGLATQFPKVRFDNDPENMLAHDEPIRLLHNEVKQLYSLYDFVIVGIVNTNHADGVFNVKTLDRIHTLTHQLLSLKQGADGRPLIDSSLAGKRATHVDLAPQSPWNRALDTIFKHNPNRLFDEEGNSAIISHELISPSVVDNIKQAELGSLKLEYLMESAPETREDALTLRDDAMSNPLYKGTLVSEDEKAICLYIPIKDKTYSYNVATLVKKLTNDWEGDDKVFITGQPVAQDTFGVEMLVQMATSAPLAGLAVFLLLLFFFRKLSLIIAPMLVAIMSVVATMGLLIGLGFDVHIMSSMIAIFLMPIAVADAVHILSEFFDLYHKFGDKERTMKHVIAHLFRPMLYTSLTTMAGFASLGLTPIPPVKVFGLHVAFGVGLAWLFTVTFIPAYVMVAVPNRVMRTKGNKACYAGSEGIMSRLLGKIGKLGHHYWKGTLTATLVVILISIYGMTRIRVNDNPVKWFTSAHPIRVSDSVLNNHFGGTYTAYLSLSSKETAGTEPRKLTAMIADAAETRFAADLPNRTSRFVTAARRIARETTDTKELFSKLTLTARELDSGLAAPWNVLADEINYLEPQGLSLQSLADHLKSRTNVNEAVRSRLLARLAPHSILEGEELIEKALEISEENTSVSFERFLSDKEAELTAPLFKRPDMLRYVQRLQEDLLASEVVGKTSSAVDALSKAHYELMYQAPPDGASDEILDSASDRNRQNWDVPDTSAAVGQVFTQLEGMKKKDTLFHLVTRDYSQANIWVQLKSGDNVDMEAVVQRVEAFVADNRPPVELSVDWAGLTYLNVVWQDKMVRGMISSLASSFAVVLVMMIVLFRSPLYGALAMIPLSVTIAFIYGLIGIVGKDYDMPVAILSALTLGLSVDFAIHFLERAREEHDRLGTWREACSMMFREPATAISRNAITISIGFTPLLVAPLVPYRTVGFFLSTIMAVSWLSTLFILPALLTLLKKWTFRSESCDI